MTQDLANLGVGELIKLGGLRKSCNAPLRCVAHGLNLPCDLCELEGQQAVACSACGKVFATPPANTQNRPCASVTQFQTQGVIAFAEEARHALDQKAQQQAEEEEERRQKNEINRALDHADELVEEARRRNAEIERRLEELAHRVGKMTIGSPEPDAEAIRIEKADRERYAKARARAAAERGARLAWLSILAAVPSAVMGAMMLWDRPLIDLPDTSAPYILCYLFFGTLTWFAGISPLFGRQVAHQTLRWWAPAAWALVAFSWPGVAGLVACYTAAQVVAAGLGWFALFMLVAGVVIWGFCNNLMMHLATFLSMRDPWPESVKPRLMRQTHWLWIGVILTGILTVTIYHGGSLPGAAPLPPSAGSEHAKPPTASASVANAERVPEKSVNQTPGAIRIDTGEAEAPGIRYHTTAIQLRIFLFWERPATSKATATCTVEVQLKPSGEVIQGSVRIIKPSGDPAYDRSAIEAVYQASPLPVPTDNLFQSFRKVKVTFLSD